jgi:hypothetical protein
MKMAVNIPKETKNLKSFRWRRTLTYFIWIIGAIFWAVAITSLRNPDAVYTSIPKNIEPWVLFGAGLVLFVITYYVWRCPVCHKFLGISTGISKCKKCGTVFEKRGY